jgi:hypothetical protein
MIILCKTSDMQKATISNTKTSKKDNFINNSSNIKTCLNSNGIKITSNFVKKIALSSTAGTFLSTCKKWWGVKKQGENP